MAFLVLSTSHGGVKGQCHYRPELVGRIQLSVGKRVAPACVTPG